MHQLRNFPENELIFNDEETKQILLFFFDDDKKIIDNMSIGNVMKNFAQGLLVEAVDATYAYGYVEAIFKSAYKFKGPANFLKTFARKALAHWFKHAKRSDLIHVKIYESVRVQLKSSFVMYFHLLKDGLAKLKGRSIPSTMVPSRYAKRTPEIAWG